MKQIIRVGRPTHLKIGQTSETVCGLIGSAIPAAYDPRDVDCLRCMKTKKYKAMMKGEKS